MANLYPVIMCGGVGSRLWPLSRQSRPKQFIPLLGDRTLFQQAVERVCGLRDFSRLIVITGREQSLWVVRQLDVMGVQADVILEPEGRDSAAAVACAAVHIQELDSEGVVIVIPSDHYIPDGAHFRSDLERAAQEAQQGHIVTLGIKPMEPSPAFGYILPKNPGEKIGPIARFVEKPDVKRAQSYIDQGYLWNCGVFIARAQTLVEEFAHHAPQIFAAVKSGLTQATEAEDGLLLGAPFLQAERKAFDVAVMEKTSSGAVLRSEIQWSDLGAWDALYNAMSKDSSGNAAVGDVMFHNSSGCAVRVNNGAFAVLSSVENLNVVVEDDVVLVSSIKDAHKMKEVVDQLKSARRPELEALPHRRSLRRVVDDLSLWINTAALPLWATAGFNFELGIWRENLDADAQPTFANVRGRVHGRMSYVYATALKNGWQGQADTILQPANQRGCLLFDREDGLRRAAISNAGKPVIEEAKLYDQTFVLLAHAAEISAVASKAMHGVDNVRGFEESAQASFEGQSTAVDPNPICRIDQIIAKANRAMDAVEAAFGEDVRGGRFHESGDHAHVSNPMMHLFEAVMAMANAVEETGHDASRWNELSANIAKFAVETLVDPDMGSVFEIYDADWKPVRKPTAGGSLINELEPGHQFEWAWLFVSWAKMSGDKAFIVPAEKLFRFGAMGINPQTGAVVNRMNDELLRTTGSARLWPQAEWAKAALALYDVCDESKRGYFEGHITRASDLVNRYLQTPVRGLWFDYLAANNTLDAKPSPASSLYHLVSMLEQMKKTSAAHPDL